MKLKDILYSFFYWFIIIINTIFFGTAAIAISFLDSSGRKAQNVAKLWARTILYLLNIKVVADGLSNIDSKCSYLIVSNHQSYVDIFILLSLLNVDFKFVAKSSLFKIPFLGWTMKRLGYISVDRKNLKKTLSVFNQINISNKAPENISDSEKKNKKNAALSILIFPEGTRSDDGKLKDFKTAGLKRFIEILNLPILPVVIMGTFDILKKNSLRIYGGKTVRFKVLKPVLIEANNTKSTSDLIQNVAENINKEFFS